MLLVAKGSRGNLESSPQIKLPNGETVLAPALSTIRQRWKDFISAWPWREGNQQISPDVTNSVTQVRTLLKH